MCTLLAAVGLWPGAPLVVGANRDERTARPASPPSVWPGPPRIVAPRDDLAGGTWLGLSERALFVAITNRAGRPADPTRRSRGALVADALQAGSAASLHRDLRALDPAMYNPFHLFYADRETAHLTWSDGHALHHRDLPKGLHIVTERSLGAADASREHAIASLFHRDIAGRPLAPALLRPLLVQHAEVPSQGTCVHDDARGYGTRSSLLLTLGDRWADTTWLWAEGRPCQTPFADRSDLLSALARGAP